MPNIPYDRECSCGSFDVRRCGLSCVVAEIFAHTPYCGVYHGDARQIC